MISVIMPTFNSTKFIDKALQSLYEQTIEDWELIIIQEFGASDGTPEFLKTLTDARIKVIYCDEWVGISKALNMGIDAARGEFIARMDDDDICLPTRFEKQIAYLKENPDIGICGTEVKLFGDASWTWPIESDSAINKALMLFYQPVIHPTFMMRKNILTQHNIRYAPEFTSSEDYEILSRLKNVTKIGNVAEVLLKYRRHETAASNKTNDGIPAVKKVQKTMFSEMGLKLTSEELDIACVHGEWRTYNENDFESTIPVLFSIFRKILFYNEELLKNKNPLAYDKEALLQVLRKRWRGHFSQSSLPKSGKTDLEEKYKFLFLSEITFYNFVYNNKSGQNNSTLIGAKPALLPK